jgi:multidrug efflux pump subunit AcrB
MRCGQHARPPRRLDPHRPGEIILRASANAICAENRRHPVATRADGSEVLLGDVATLIDGFEDVDLSSRISTAETAVVINVFRVGNEDTLTLAGW